MLVGSGLDMSNNAPLVLHHRAFSGYVKLNYPSGHLSQLSKISSNMNLLWQLMCHQIYNSKDEINDDEKSHIIMAGNGVLGVNICVSLIS